MKNPKITFDELLKEANKFKTQRYDKELTNEQKAFIEHCRIGDKKVPYYIMANLWSKYWYKIGRRAINQISIEYLRSINKYEKQI